VLLGPQSGLGFGGESAKVEGPERSSWASMSRIRSSLRIEAAIHFPMRWHGDLGFIHDSSAVKAKNVALLRNMHDYSPAKQNQTATADLGISRCSTVGMETEVVVAWTIPGFQKSSGHHSSSRNRAGGGLRACGHEALRAYRPATLGHNHHLCNRSWSSSRAVRYLAQTVLTWCRHEVTPIEQTGLDKRRIASTASQPKGRQADIFRVPCLFSLLM
jgi:hypothetical protein